MPSRPVDGDIRPAVAVVVAGDRNVGADAPLIGDIGCEVRARPENVPDARGRPVDRDIRLAVAVEVTRDRKVGADTPLIGDICCGFELDNNMFQIPVAG